MFQSFDPVSDRSFAATHLPMLREQLKELRLDYFLVPHDDEYLNEYLPAAAERLMWVSGFSGSAGVAIIGMTSAVLFVDGRYTLQVRDEVDDAFFSFEDRTAISPGKWLSLRAPAAARIGYDPRLHAHNDVNRLSIIAAQNGLELIAAEENPVDRAWQDRPLPPASKAVPHPLSFAGQSHQEKIKGIAAHLDAQRADAVLLTAPNSLAWLFNIRGKDVHATPLSLGRALVFKAARAQLFIDPAKVTEELRVHLGPDIDILPEAEIETAFRGLVPNDTENGPGSEPENNTGNDPENGNSTESRTGAAADAPRYTVLVDPNVTPAWFFQRLEVAGATVKKQPDPCSLPRARKNRTETEGARAAHQRDGVALVRFLHWLDTHENIERESEISAAKQLEAFRRASGLLEDISFDSISGAGPNGAIVHYRVTTRTERPFRRGELYLIDSGGQYRDGTTDVTRTVPFGPATDEMRDRYTRVLKGHLALGHAVFPEGTCGYHLDGLARAPLWEAGLDYAHGTGHGVGSYLGVHEGPQNISRKAIEVPLAPGMILSNEPGYYKAGAYGIRIENLVTVAVHDRSPAGESRMLEFETLTLAPYERRLIDTSLLTPREIAQVNAYHSRVFDSLQNSLEPATRSWLADVTIPL